MSDRLFVAPWTAACQVSLSFTISQNLLKLISIESGMSSYYLIPYYPLLLLPSIFPSIRVFSSESVLHIRWLKYWNLSFSNECSGLITFRIDWLDLLAVQGTLKSLIQHHSLKASVLWCSAFFMVQLSHPYMIAGKMIALIIWAFVSKVVFLLFNTLCRFVIKNSTFKKLRSWHRVHHFMANRWGNSGNSDRVYFLGLQNHCRW